MPETYGLVFARPATSTARSILSLPFVDTSYMYRVVMASLAPHESPVAVAMVLVQVSSCVRRCPCGVSFTKHGSGRQATPAHRTRRWRFAIRARRLDEEARACRFRCEAPFAARATGRGWDVPPGRAPRANRRTLHRPRTRYTSEAQNVRAATNGTDDAREDVRGRDPERQKPAVRPSGLLPACHLLPLHRAPHVWYTVTTCAACVFLAAASAR
ncbi:hypothetical protein GUJ93_ZPchr0001g29487 [Zizania palustris]|uniref:Uncharacterized protein n=1 Tax=Zizania palustris TaxID=103762 RepID=A0A8J5RUB6_ZIZPA|nr:hypothetical protein GUJ93_ZPchr0001g29487 [Zizania palustris]